MDAYDLDQAAAHGEAWARMVDEINDRLPLQLLLRGEHPAAAVAVGAGDWEPGWSRVPPVDAWVAGFSSTVQAPLFGSRSGMLINFGAASGCPLHTHADGVCNNGWRQGDILRLSLAAGTGTALPQIYRTDRAMARQWGRIAKLGAAEGTPLPFLGSLTQHQACIDVGMRYCRTIDNTPAEGWRQLFWVLGSDEPGLAAIDMRWSRLGGSAALVVDDEVRALLDRLG